MATGLADDVMADNGDGLDFAECLSKCPSNCLGVTRRRTCRYKKAVDSMVPRRGNVCVIHAPNLVETG